jgi:hypothetical protein
MGIRSAIQKAIKAGFGGLGDLPESVNFDHIASSEYETTTGVASASARRYMVTGVFSRFSNSKMPFPPTSVDVLTDVKFISPRVDWYFVPKTRDSLDRLENESTVTYEVMDVETDPAEATYVLRLKRRG